jgi:hypothetical protein
MTGLAVAGAGLVAALAGGWLRWHREAPKTCTGLFAVSGLAIGDVLGRLIATGLTKLTAPSGPQQPTGVGVGLWLSLLLAGVLLAASAELVVKGMWPRRARPAPWHPWLALTLPTIAIAASAPLIGPLMSGLAAGIGGLGTAVISTATGHPTTEQARIQTTTHTTTTTREKRP